MKECPFCWEKIQTLAKKCRFCWERLNENELKTVNWKSHETRTHNTENKINFWKLSLWKRIVANIIDIIAMWIFWIWLFINLFLYYSNWTTIWLMLFWAFIVDKTSFEKANSKLLFKRALLKYLWLFLGLFFCFFPGSLLEGMLWNSWWPATTLIFLINLIFVWIYLIFLLKYYNKRWFFWREYHSNTWVFFNSKKNEPILKNKNKFIDINIDKTELWKKINFDWNIVFFDKNAKVWDECVIKWKWNEGTNWWEDWDLIYVINKIKQ